MPRMGNGGRLTNIGLVGLLTGPQWATLGCSSKQNPAPNHVMHIPDAELDQVYSIFTADGELAVVVNVEKETFQALTAIPTMSNEERR